MHRITWVHGAQSMSWLLPEGVLALPEDVEHVLGARCVLLVGEVAFLVGGERIRALPAGAALDAQGWPEARDTGWSLRWSAESPPRPIPLTRERTRGDEARASAGTLRLFDEDEREIPLDDGPALIGRQLGCHVRLDDRRVSGVHCAVLRVGGALRVVDLASRNGTYLDGARVGAAVVTRAARLDVGRVRFTCRPSEAGAEHLALRSEAMQRVDVQVRRFAPVDAPVLVTGESGVGKDVVARRLHHLSGRAGPFVAINAAVVSPSLAGSELFGHVRGAFTGAESDRDGAFLQAHGGTLFLDEIGELPLPVQAELLRVVEQRRVRRIGEIEERPVDVRLVTATHRSLTLMVERREFREDLFHRLCVLPIHVPPLRERPEDLEAVVHHFLASLARPRTLSTAAWKKLQAHTWPGNIRELLNTLRRACVMSDDDEIGAAQLTLTPTARDARPMDELISSTVVATYEATGRSVSATARKLGLQRSTVYRVVREAQKKWAPGRTPEAKKGGEGRAT